MERATLDIMARFDPASCGLWAHLASAVTQIVVSGELSPVFPYFIWGKG